MNKLKKTGIRARIWLLCLVPALALGCSITAPFSRIPIGNVPEPVMATPVIATPAQAPLSAEVMDEQALLVNLYARANPAVVNITIYGQQGGQTRLLGQGSGFIYDETGRIITNDHVVEGAERVEVTFSDGTIREAEVVGQDPNSDLAVVKVEQLPGGIAPLPLGEMGELAVGQTVIAIGNPFGLDGTLTRGVISALGRTIPALTPFSIPQAIQTDAAINPGNSGGPLLDLHGHVIGVNAQIETDGTSRSNSGVGFAIPVSVVSRVVPILIEKGRYEWSWLGVRGGNVTPALVEAMQLPVERGAYILEVTAGGPAAQAGLRGADTTVKVNDLLVLVGGDVITAIDNQPVKSFDDLLVYIALNTMPDQNVTLTILRAGKTQAEVRVRLSARPATLGTTPAP
jgi:2-alkenal reductase